MESVPGKKIHYKVSVKDLVDFSCRTGDLWNESLLSPTAEEGIRAHKKLQGKYTLDTTKEFVVKKEVKASALLDLELDAGVVNRISSGYFADESIPPTPIQLELKGRADLVEYDASDTSSEPIIKAVTEIKSTYVAPDSLPENVLNLHWAQLKVYGFCLLDSRKKIDTNATDSREKGDSLYADVKLQLLYYKLDEQREYKLFETYRAKALQEFVFVAALKYVCWRYLVERQRARQRQKAQDLAFPHERYRQGQKQFAQAAYRAIRDKQELLVQAPTGIGKTISAMFPAVKAYGEDLNDKVIYLTAKRTGVAVVKQSLALFAEHGCDLQFVEIQAKARACACLNGDYPIDPNESAGCILSNGFYDRLHGAMYELIASSTMDKAGIYQIAAKHNVCAFELSLKVLPWVDVVICDYNYIFDPHVRLPYFDATADRIVVLIDEAHNLVDRGRSMYSAALDANDIQGQLKLLKGHTLRKPTKALLEAVKCFQKKDSRDQDPFLLPEQDEKVKECSDRLIEAVFKLQSEGGGLEVQFADWMRQVYRYSAISNLYADVHRSIFSPSNGMQGAELELFCLDPRSWIKAINRRLHAIVAFSATLYPPAYYQYCLGFSENAPFLSLSSPFDPERQRTLLVNYIDTRWQYREASLGPLAALIAGVVNLRAGKYMVFMPSYAYLKNLLEHFSQAYPDISYISQEASFSENERNDFLQRFEEDKEISLAFTMIGGIFAEGIDYLGDRLHGAIIVSPGLPQPNLVNKEIEAYYGRKEKAKGKEYAYTIPAMTRVAQSAGRVIRSEDDAGIIVLVDARFSQNYYRQYTPAHWQPWLVNNLEQAKTNLESFWDSLE